MPLRVVLITAIPTYLEYYDLLFDGRQSYMVYLTFPTTITLSPKAKESMWGMSQI